MARRRRVIPAIADETVSVAQAAFSNGTRSRQIRDDWEGLYSAEPLVDLYAAEGPPSMAGWRWALVIVMHYVENLSDRQAAEAVRDRIAWKYALSLDLANPGFDHSVLSEVRLRLVAHAASQRLGDGGLNQLKAQGLLKGHRPQRTDSSHVLAAIRALNRLENGGETLRHTLNSLAGAAPSWLEAHRPAEWADR